MNAKGFWWLYVGMGAFLIVEWVLFQTQGWQLPFLNPHAIKGPYQPVAGALLLGLGMYRRKVTK